MPRRSRIETQVDESFAVIGLLLSVVLAFAAVVAYFILGREGWALGIFVAGLCIATMVGEKSDGCIMVVLTLFGIVLVLLRGLLEIFLGLF